MSTDDILLTPEGADKLRQELEMLRGPGRAEIAARLRHATQQGDITENADYTAAKEKQAFLEGRIQELEEVFRRAVIVEDGSSAGIVAVGSTVVVSEPGGQPEIYQLVSSIEADASQGRISDQSPIGEALLDKRVGDIAVAETPGGSVELTILEIR
ncbi:MAG: transcription elongation factor GreA [Anaerolineales bacterium]|jgi:transcription elongation factor GreA